MRRTTFGCANAECRVVDGFNNVQFRNWGAILGNDVLHVTGADILPSSVYEVQVLPASCQGSEDTCTAASCPLTIQTAKWGDVNGSGMVNVLDIGFGVDKVKDLAAGTFIKPRVQVQPNVPDPTANVNVLDIANVVDAVKGSPYPFLPGECP